MADNLYLIRNFMVENKLDFLLVNSTNEFLVEYNSLVENSRYHLTNFSGSTGDALVSMDKVYLFVDGRYHIQADLEVDHDIVTVIKLSTGQNFYSEMISKIPKKATLGIFTKKISQKNAEFIQNHVLTKLLDNDPLDVHIPDRSSQYIKLDYNLCGKSVENKIKDLNLSDNEALLLTNLEDVSYIFNIRDFSAQFSSKVKGKAIIQNQKALLFKADEMIDFENYIKGLNTTILVDKSTISAYDYSLVKDKVKILDKNPVTLMKSIKTDAEIQQLIKAFSNTDKTVLSIRDYIMNTDNISEFDISTKLEEEFYKYGAVNLSFNPIVAKDKNSALAHYSKASQYEIISDGSLILIDCGAYYNSGLATDITRVFVKGKPSTLQKKVYTTVLKAFLNAYNTPIDNHISGYDIDNSTREFFEKHNINDFVFNHGLGHGIGINVHEAPPNLGRSEIAKTELKNNMCFTIEPGLYNAEHFGIRLENSCYLKDGKIESFVHVPYEDKLIDYSMLTEQEKIWLDEFGVI